MMAEPTTQEPVAEEENKQSASAEAESQAVPTTAPKRRRRSRNVPNGQIHVLASFNNTIVTVTDEKGNALTAASAGASGFRGSKKGTAYAAQVAAEKAISSAKQTFGLSKAEVFVKGVGLGRDAAVRTLATQNIQIENIKDVTGVPHGGVRPRRPKRN
ncbi:MAG TPA: 30S ribosomal protein S11 [Candidatus Saccharimonadales bacterium]|nr:30S ribosomal protein S11 [Candidatus Saccharimonadales bacterium]